MLKLLRNITFAVAGMVAVAPMASAVAQDDTQSAAQTPATFFKYPVAPDTCTTLESRTNYLVANFWNNYNLSKPIKDSIGFDGAFRDYVTFFKFAHKNIVFSSIKDFMNKAQSNKANYIMIMDIAEKALYSTGAEYWSDEAYLPFAKFFVASKGVKSEYKERYKAHIRQIEHSMTGAIASDIELTTVDKSKKKLSDIKDRWVVLFFNDPDCYDCSISRLRLSTNVTINQSIDEGRLAVLSVFPGEYSSEWAEAARSYSDKWIVGASEKVDEDYDIRLIPSFYLLDKDHKIVGKNLGLEDILNLIVQ